MTDRVIATSIEHIEPELLEEVRRRRVFAFVADYIAIIALSFFVGIFVLFLGLITFGLGWLLFGMIVPGVATLYFVLTLASDKQATPGMRLFALKMVRQDGTPIDFWTSFLHLLLFWAGNMVLPVFILLVSLFTNEKRLVHDILLGTVVMRTDS